MRRTPTHDRTATLHRRAFMLAFAACGASSATARAAERIRIVGLMVSLPLNDLQWTRLPVFKRNFEKLGWIEGRNLRYEIRSSHGGPAARVAAVRELVGAPPRRDHHQLDSRDRGPAGRDADHPDRVRDRRRPGRQRLRRKPGAAGRKRDRLHQQPRLHGRQVDPVPQGDGPAHHPHRHAVQSRRPCRATAAISLEPIEQAAPALRRRRPPWLPLGDPARDRRRDRAVMRASPRGLILPPDPFTVAHRERDRGGGGASSRAGDLSAALLHRCGRADVLRRRAGSAHRPTMSISSCAAPRSPTCRCNRRASSSC